MDSINDNFTVIVFERATDMLVQHMRFLAEVSPQVADKLPEEITESLNSLRHFLKEIHGFLIHH